MSDNQEQRENCTFRNMHRHNSVNFKVENLNNYNFFEKFNEKAIEIYFKDIKKTLNLNQTSRRFQQIRTWNQHSKMNQSMAKATEKSNSFPFNATLCVLYRTEHNEIKEVIFWQQDKQQ